MWPATLRKIKTEIEAKVKVEKSQNLILENAASPTHPRFGVVRRISNSPCKIVRCLRSEVEYLNCSQFLKYVNIHSRRVIMVQ